MRRKRQRIAATRLFTSSAPIVILIFHRCVHLLVKIIFKKLRLVELLLWVVEHRLAAIAWRRRRCLRGDT